MQLIVTMLSYDPAGRISAQDAMQHAYFREIHAGQAMAENGGGGGGAAAEEDAGKMAN